MEGVSGMELATKVGATAGSGAVAGFGAGAGLGPCPPGHLGLGTTRTRHSTGGTLKDYTDGTINMNFLDSYFSQVSEWQVLWVRYLIYIRDLFI